MLGPSHHWPTCPLAHPIYLLHLFDTIHTWCLHTWFFYTIRACAAGESSGILPRRRSHKRKKEENESTVEHVSSGATTVATDCTHTNKARGRVTPPLVRMNIHEPTLAYRGAPCPTPYLLREHKQSLHTNRTTTPSNEFKKICFSVG